MEIAGYAPRVIDAGIERRLKDYVAVRIVGPKGCGKTRTAFRHANSAIRLDDPAGALRSGAHAKIDPERALAGEPPRLMDEPQEVPEIWDAVLFEEERDSGSLSRYILTASSLPPDANMRGDGAGRVAMLRMHTMSLLETGDSTGAVSLRKICGGEAPGKALNELTYRRLAERIAVGGWPASLRLDRDRERIASRYVETLLAGDLFRSGSRPGSREGMRRLLRSLARFESSAPSVRAICRDAAGPGRKSMDPRTALAYLDALDRMFLLENQPPFLEDLGCVIRVKNAPKRHLADPSLACALLGADARTLEDDPGTFSLLFESLCAHGLRVYAESFGGKLYWYQDYAGNEFDAVIRLPGGEWSAFDVRLGAKTIDEAAKDMRRISDLIHRKTGGRGPSVLCVVSGLAPGAYVREDGVFVVPIGVLGP